MIKDIVYWFLICWAIWLFALLMFGFFVRMYEIQWDIPKDEKFWRRYDKLVYISSIGTCKDPIP